jgi:PAS domain S-box-containing protein
MAEERDALLARLRDSDAALERAQRMARLAHVVTGPGGAFEDVSATLPEMLGIARADLPKTTREWLDLIHPDDRETFRARAIIAAKTGVQTAVEYRVRHASGGWVHVRQLMEPLAAGEDPRDLWFNTLQDVTAERQAREEIRRLAADLERRVKDRTSELEAANRELAAFDYSITHDLRAPLRHIQGFGKILLDREAPALTEEGRDYLRRIISASERMDRLIMDLYKLSTTSRTQLVRSEVDLGMLARSVYVLLCKETDATMKLVIQKELVAQADRGLMQVVLENLLGNAAKFTRGRAVPRIDVGKTAEGAFYVRDNGVGFDMANAGKLFEPFRRFHTPAEFEGSGIGLATVRRIVERHGGRVWAESAPGQGTTVYFTVGKA